MRGILVKPLISLSLSTPLPLPVSPTTVLFLFLLTTSHFSPNPNPPSHPIANPFILSYPSPPIQLNSRFRSTTHLATPQAPQSPTTSPRRSTVREEEERGEYVYSLPVHTEVENGQHERGGEEQRGYSVRTRREHLELDCFPEMRMVVELDLTSKCVAMVSVHPKSTVQRKPKTQLY